MKKLFTNKKVIAALVVLVIAVLSVTFGLNLGDGTASAITSAICQVVECV